jgi:predicted chitinase
MKATALAFLVVGVLAGCGGGEPGARENGSDPASGGGTGAVTSGGSTPIGPSAGSTSVVPGGGGSGTGTGGTPPVTGGGAGPTPMPCGPAWMAGTTYAEGDIVLFQGSYYVAEHENPGYDPTISTYFWEPYTCTTGGGTTGGSSGGGGSAPVGDSSFDDIVSEDLFHQMFPDRNGFYTYQGLVDATRKYSAFAGTGTDEQRKREAAAFLANVARETGELIYIEQIEKDVYCQPSERCPCQPGKQYYGRGPIQISWNYNYCAAGAELGYELLTQPELVAQNPTIAWATGLWFWMTQRGAGNFTPHQGIVEGHGFGETIRSINGGQECNGAWAEAVVARVTFYERFCQLLGVTPGDNLYCG